MLRSFREDAPTLHWLLLAEKEGSRSVQQNIQITGENRVGFFEFITRAIKGCENDERAREDIVNEFMEFYILSLDVCFFYERYVYTVC